MHVKGGRVSSREWIVLIPALARNARQQQRKLFVPGMVATAERPHLLRVDEPDISPAAVRVPETENCHVLSVRAQATFIDIVTGRTHARYFDNPEAVSAVLQ
jgi:hypothetical protein